MPPLSVSQGTSISLYLLRVINQGGCDHFVGGLTNKTLRLGYVTIQSMESICMTHTDALSGGKAAPSWQVQTHKAKC